jgi:hypothetical protein
MGDLCEFLCCPVKGGFSIELRSEVGTKYWIRYYVVGSGGYQESGEISGVVSGPREIIRQVVKVPVIEVGIVSMSLSRTGAKVRIRRVPARSRLQSETESRSIPQTKIEALPSPEE